MLFLYFFAKLVKITQIKPYVARFFTSFSLYLSYNGSILRHKRKKT